MSIIHHPDARGEYLAMQKRHCMHVWGMGIPAASVEAVAALVGSLRLPPPLGGSGGEGDVRVAQLELRPHKPSWL